MNSIDEKKQGLPSISFNKEQNCYLLQTNYCTSTPIAEVFQFFSNAKNLEILTPPWLNFTILDHEPEKMFVGKMINYRLKIHGIPMHWRSEITVWEPPFRFVDEQRVGPYKRWHHEHLFEEVSGKTVIKDIVHYQVPFGNFFPGKLVERFFVRKDLVKIFTYRLQVLREKFKS
jgi:ligand-binding SRPBCC domain-containing protein